MSILRDKNYSWKGLPSFSATYAPIISGKRSKYSTLKPIRITKFIVHQLWNHGYANSK